MPALAYGELRRGALVACLTLGDGWGYDRRLPRGRGEHGWFDIAAAPALVNLQAPAGVTFTTRRPGAVLEDRYGDRRDVIWPKKDRGARGRVSA